MLAAEKRESELQKERMEKQQQQVTAKLQQQKQVIMKQQVIVRPVQSSGLLFFAWFICFF